MEDPTSSVSKPIEIRIISYEHKTTKDYNKTVIIEVKFYIHSTPPIKIKHTAPESKILNLSLKRDKKLTMFYIC